MVSSTLSIFDGIKQRKQQCLSNAQIKDEGLLSFDERDLAPFFVKQYKVSKFSIMSKILSDLRK